MTRVERIEHEVSSLTQEELEAFRQWFLEYEASVEVKAVENAQWHSLATQGLARAYGDDEPEYSDADIKP